MDSKHIIIDFIDTEYDDKLNDELMKWKNSMVTNEYQSSLYSLSRSNSDSDHSGSHCSRNSKQNNGCAETCSLLSNYMMCKKAMYMHIHHIGKMKTMFLCMSSGAITIISIAITPSFVHSIWILFFLIAANIISTGLLSIVICNNLYANSLLAMCVANAYGKLASTIENQTENAQIIEKVEYKLSELENHFVVYIPDIVKNAYRMVCYMNIFDMIKKIKMSKKRVSFKIANIQREIVAVMKTANTELSNTEKTQMHHLGGMKEGARKEKTDAEDAFTYLHELLTIEKTNAAEYFENYTWIYAYPMQRNIHHGHNNKIVDEYLQNVVYRN